MKAKANANPRFPYEDTLVESWNGNLGPHAEASNPVLTAADVTDAAADFVADPFIYSPDADDSFSDHHMFFEMQPGGGAAISHATSTDGYTWTYNQIVVDPAHHVAFPQVFRWDGSYYLLGQGDDTNKLWRTDSAGFPTSWTVVVSDLITERTYSSTDLALLRWDIDGDGNDEWVGLDNTGNTDLHVWYTDGTLENNTWTAHSGNPVVSSDQTQSRPAGRPIVRSNHIAMFYQDTVDEYGDKVRAWEIDTLTTSNFNQTEYSTSPILEETGSGWNSGRMHHYDPWWFDAEGRWVAAVDGASSGTGDWKIGIYDVPTISNNSAQTI